MARETVLITGGAGFIGSHLADELITTGDEVRILDALLPQVHPEGRPGYLNPEAELQIGDVRDDAAVRRALEGVNTVVHLAGAVGVGQSMYEIKHYCSVNVQGTATLLEAIVKGPHRPDHLLIASSMTLYGEGLFSCPSCGPKAPKLRPREQMERRDWPVRCPDCSEAMKEVATPETKPLLPTSIYAINKRDQEEMVLAVARSVGIPAVALRLFSVYGDRQALSNPYTGVAAIFSACLLNGRRPPLFEDGHQIRDFVHVSDVVRACRLAIEKDDLADEVFNVGTGQPTSLLDLLDLLRREISDHEPEVLHSYRKGDVRACYADISRAQAQLGFEPRMPLERGVRELASWVASQSSHDRSRDALVELRRHGLVD
jgi:dTDP-L-rhamnose 4-epimerase